MTGKRPSLKHFRVWGYKVGVRPYNPQLKKLDLKIISGFFIGYCVGSRGSRFHCPSNTTRVIESNREIYFENESENDENLMSHTINFRDESVVVPIPLNPFLEKIVLALTHNDVWC